MVGYTVLRQNNIYSIRATNKKLASRSGHITVIKGNPELVSQIDGALKILKENDTFDQLADKWAGFDTVLIKKDTIWYTVTGFGAGLVLLIILGGTVYLFRLQKNNLEQEITERLKAEEKILRMAMTT